MTRARTTGLLALLVLAFPIAVTAAPPNDDCAGATIVVPTSRYEETLDTSTATTAVDDPLQSCTTAGPDQNTHSIWYQFTAPENGILSVYTMNVVFPADPPTIVSVHAGACGALTEVECYDSDTPIASYLHAPVSAGQTYWIDITNEAGSAGGLVELVVYFDPDSPICPHDGGDLRKGKLSLAKLAAPTEDAQVKLSGRLFLRAALPDVVSTGLQILAEDEEDAYAPIVEWSARTLAIPPGGPGTGCHPKDGWVGSANGSSYRYRNVSNALPPACAPGSANGLTDVRLHARSKDDRIVDVKVKTRDTTLAQDPGAEPRIRLSVTLEATIGPTNADRCAATFFPLECTPNGSATKLTCRSHD